MKLRMLEITVLMREVRIPHCKLLRLTYLAFLSWLRLSIYMAVVSIAIMISFHLRNQPSVIERKTAFPIGLIFWFLSLACLISGFATYIKTVTKYCRKQA